ncbi:hypothetical protein PO909_008613 [Leuciscus waleckii]
MVNGAEPTLSRLGLHPPVAPTTGAIVGSACPPMSCTYRMDVFRGRLRQRNTPRNRLRLSSSSPVFNRNNYLPFNPNARFRARARRELKRKGKRESQGYTHDELYDHLEELEIMKVEKQVNEAMTWMNNKMNLQSKQSLSQDPAVKAQEIQAKTKGFCIPDEGGESVPPAWNCE